MRDDSRKGDNFKILLKLAALTEKKVAHQISPGTILVFFSFSLSLSVSPSLSPPPVVLLQKEG